MFDNIGGKIKTLAEVVCILGIVGSVLWAIATLLQSNYHHVTILESILILGLGSLGSWVGSFITYGFGELIENTTRIHEDNLELQKILTLIKNKSGEIDLQENGASAISDNCEGKKTSDSKQENESLEMYKVDRSANEIVCPVCGKVQKPDRKLCWNCGALFTDEE